MKKKTGEKILLNQPADIVDSVYNNENGYIKFSNGIIIEYGHVQVSNGDLVLYNLPLIRQSPHILATIDYTNVYDQCPVLYLHYNTDGTGFNVKYTPTTIDQIWISYIVIGQWKSSGE